MRTRLLHLIPNEYGVQDWTMCGEWVGGLPKGEWITGPALVGIDSSADEVEYYFRNPPLRLESCPSCFRRLREIKREQEEQQRQQKISAAVGYCFGGGLSSE